MTYYQWLFAVAVASVICPVLAAAERPSPAAVPALADHFAFLDEEDSRELKAVADLVLPEVAKADDRELARDTDGGTCGPSAGQGCSCGSSLSLCVTGDAISAWDSLTPCRDGPLDVGGWVQAGFYNYNTGTFNNYPHNLNVNQVWLFAQKEADGSCGFDWGFRLDYLYGTDAPDTQAYGNPPDRWDEGWDNGNFYGHAIPQAYLDVAHNDLNVRIGHFYTIMGYEVAPAPDNFFYSHAFTFFYAEPFTHTGVLASYAVGDHVEVYGGWSAGFDTGFDRFGGDIFVGGVRARLTDDVTLFYGLTTGKIGLGSTATGYSHSVVLDVALTDRLNYVFQSDFIDYRGTEIGAPGRAAIFHRYGINQYLLYDINDCLAAGVRFEWFNTNGLPGGRSDLYELTCGVNYRPHPNLALRPELRWDYDEDGSTVAAGRHDTVGFGIDMILTF